MASGRKGKVLKPSHAVVTIWKGPVINVSCGMLTLQFKITQWFKSCQLLCVFRSLYLIEWSMRRSNAENSTSPSYWSVSYHEPMAPRSMWCFDEGHHNEWLVSIHRQTRILDLPNNCRSTANASSNIFNLSKSLPDLFMESPSRRDFRRSVSTSSKCCMVEPKPRITIDSRRCLPERYRSSLSSESSLAKVNPEMVRCCWRKRASWGCRELHLTGSLAARFDLLEESHLSLVFSSVLWMSIERSLISSLERVLKSSLERVSRCWSNLLILSSRPRTISIPYGSLCSKKLFILSSRLGNAVVVSFRLRLRSLEILSCRAARCSKKLTE